MWNLAYGDCGQRVKLGTKADPGRPAKRKRRATQRRIIPRAAKQAHRIRFKLDAIPRRERLAFLLSALEKGAWIPGRIIDKRRREFNLNKRTLLPLHDAKCYVCRHTAAHRHHVIPIFRGGSNRSENLVPLCSKCHGSIHPWLTVNSCTAAGLLPACGPETIELTGQITRSC